MLNFVKENQKLWTIKNNDEIIIELKLDASTVTNKFNLIADYITKISEFHGASFDKWFINFYNRCKNNPVINDKLREDIVYLKNYVDQYVDSKDINFDKFVDRSKAKKGSILFEPDEIEQIIKTSGYLKLYSVISNNKNIPSNKGLRKKIYNIIVDEISDQEIVFKIFNVVRTRTFRYHLTDRYMWEYIKMIQCKSIDVHTVEIFNFIMNSIIILCEEDKNPITYFVGVVDESVKWFLRSVYKKSIIYDDSISTEDIHGLNVDNLKTYTYNDTLGRLKGIAYEKIYNDIEKESVMVIEDQEKNGGNDAITDFQRRVLNVEHVSPLCESLVFPLLAAMTEIPYKHFHTLSPEHSIILSTYLQRILTKVFKTEYENLFSLLNFFPQSRPAIATTYKIKSMYGKDNFVKMQNSVGNFYGFQTKILPFEIISYFVGRVARVDWCDIYTGKERKGLPMTKIEKDAIKFYTFYFASKFKDKINEMKYYMNEDF